MDMTAYDQRQFSVLKRMTALFVITLLTPSSSAEVVDWRITGTVMNIFGSEVQTLTKSFAVGDAFEHTFTVDDSVAPNYTDVDDASYPAVLAWNLSIPSRAFQITSAGIAEVYEQNYNSFFDAWIMSIFDSEDPYTITDPAIGVSNSGLPLLFHFFRFQQQLPFTTYPFSPPPLIQPDSSTPVSDYLLAWRSGDFTSFYQLNFTADTFERVEGACRFASDCVILGPTACAQQGGFYLGEGASCDTLLGDEIRSNISIPNLGNFNRTHTGTVTADASDNFNLSHLSTSFLCEPFDAGIAITLTSPPVGIGLFSDSSITISDIQFADPNLQVVDAVFDSNLSFIDAAVITTADSVVLDFQYADWQLDQFLTINIISGPAPTGGCCLPTGGCSTETQRNCEENLGGAYQGDGIPCLPPGPFDGYAVDFDGVDDYIVVPADDDNDFIGKSVSWEVWVNRDSTDTEDRILEGVGLFVGFLGNNQFIFTFLGDLSGPRSPQPFLLTDEWHHWAGTFDHTTGEAKLYLDGELIDTRTMPAATVQLDLLIGGFENRIFDGQLTDVRLWRTVRTQADIQNNMNSTFAPLTTGLSGYYPFSDGMTATDGSVFGNHGTLIGGPTFFATGRDTDDDGMFDTCDLCDGGAGSADTNADLNINFTDYIQAEACIDGPDSDYSPGCDCFDFEPDSDVDVANFADFQVMFTGP